ncbi:MAG: hypothetical protein AAF721_05735 [Myxococcota bacterium]
MGERTGVAEGIEVTFTGNSHKISEHGESPLGVSLVVHRDGRDIDVSTWLELAEPPEFTAGGLTFEYVAHDYDQFLELTLVSVGDPPAP